MKNTNYIKILLVLILMFMFTWPILQYSFIIKEHIVLYSFKTLSAFAVLPICLPASFGFFGFNNKKNYRQFSSSNNLNPEPISINPVITYINADENKIKIFADNRNKAGVYRWINNKNK